MSTSDHLVAWRCPINSNGDACLSRRVQPLLLQISCFFTPSNLLLSFAFFVLQNLSLVKQTHLYSHHTLLHLHENSNTVLSCHKSQTRSSHAQTSFERDWLLFLLTLQVDVWTLKRMQTALHTLARDGRCSPKAILAVNKAPGTSETKEKFDHKEKAGHLRSSILVLKS